MFSFVPYRVKYEHTQLYSPPKDTYPTQSLMDFRFHCPVKRSEQEPSPYGYKREATSGGPA